MKPTRSTTAVILLTFLALLSFAAAGFAFLHIGIGKVTTESALSTIETEFVRPESLDPQRRDRFAFFAGWIRSNQRDAERYWKSLRTLGIAGFACTGLAFAYLAVRERRLL